MDIPTATISMPVGEDTHVAGLALSSSLTVTRTWNQLILDVGWVCAEETDDSGGSHMSYLVDKSSCPC
jgi:hypothetical protein